VEHEDEYWDSTGQLNVKRDGHICQCDLKDATSNFLKESAFWRCVKQGLYLLWFGNSISRWCMRLVENLPLMIRVVLGTVALCDGTQKASSTVCKTVCCSGYMLGCCELILRRSRDGMLLNLMSRDKHSVTCDSSPWCLHFRYYGGVVS
jgi:hypothetical protein